MNEQNNDLSYTLPQELNDYVTPKKIKLLSYTPDGTVTGQIDDGPLHLQRHAAQLIREPDVLYKFSLKDIQLIEKLAEEKNKEM